MDAQQALADLTEISSQIEAAVLFDESGEVAGSTLAGDDEARSLAEAAARLLEGAGAFRSGGRRERVDVYFDDGSMVSLVEGSPEAATLLPVAREVLAAARR